MEQTDVNEIALMAHHAKESGFNRVDIDPSDLYELCSKIAEMKQDLDDWKANERKFKTKSGGGVNWDRVHTRKRLMEKEYN